MFLQNSIDLSHIGIRQHLCTAHILNHLVLRSTARNGNNSYV
ncbi:unnamed protein product [Penicillium roqueforti FM164]|uniref:Genomic scaffold, ProqFM164S02 n=1 Tax=Penicillium roqueforti (strain FM164) TaxID=1365484 RepID=W6Q7V1_PENRF|nr:unnamed protein product [Penicillium roqueforti FM164]